MHNKTPQTHPADSPSLARWRFIEEHLPNYYGRDDVLEDDILLRYLEGDDVAEEDIARIAADFGGDREAVRQYHTQLEARLYREAAEARRASENH